MGLSLLINLLTNTIHLVETLNSSYWFYLHLSCLEVESKTLLIYSLPLQIPAIDQLAIYFAMDSNLLHKESDEARCQLDLLEGQGEADKEETSKAVCM